MLTPSPEIINFSSVTQSFLWGLLASFTPCVFPLIPVTLALFGGQETTGYKRFLLSLSYVFGIAITYTTLGMLSAKTGIIFGAALGNPFVVLILVTFLIALSLYTLDVFSLNCTSGMQTAACKIGGKGLLGAMLMGTVSGLVAAPCIGPTLVIVLGMAAKTSNIFAGGILLLAYSLGLGTIFLALGLSSGLISKLPKCGKWLYFVKFIIAAGVMVTAFFIADKYLRAVTPSLNINDNLILILLIQNIGLLIGLVAIDRDLKAAKVIAAFLFAFGTYQFIFPPKLESARTVDSAVTDGVAIVWATSYEAGLKKAKDENKILMIDLYADWCTACKEMEDNTFSNAEVKKQLSNFALARVDFTDTTTPEALSLTEKYGIPGLPCILFVDKENGKEIDGSRITGYMGHQEFLEHIAKLETI